MITKIIQFFKNLFESPLPRQPVTTPMSARASTEMLGQWYHIGDVVERMDALVPALKSCKKYAPRIFDLHSSIGVQLLQENAKLYRKELFHLPASWRNGHRPTFGMLAMGLGEKKGVLLPTFQAFHKINMVPNVEWRPNGTIYELFSYYEHGKKKYPVSYHIHVNAAGKVHALKEYVRVSQRLKSGETITHWQWDYPGVFERIMP